MLTSEGESVPVEGTPDVWFAWLAGPDERLAHAARLILGGLEPRDAVPVDPLVLRLFDADEPVPFWAAVALGRLGPRAGAALPALRAVAADHAAFGTRQAALRALARVAPGAPETRAALRRALADPEAFVRAEAVRAHLRLPDLGPEDARHVGALGGEADAGVLAAVSRVLARCGRP